MMGMFDIIHQIKASSFVQAILEASIFYHVMGCFSIGGFTISVKVGSCGAIDIRLIGKV
jgi:hypothetical protein